MADFSTKLRLIHLLLNSFGWITSKELATSLGISVRNVKYSVTELNQDHPGLISSSSKGYSVNKALAREFLSQAENASVPLNYADRKSYLITKLLVRGEKLSIDELADQMCISPITLQNELAKIRSELADYHLNIHIKNDIVTITGLDKDKRSAVMHLINSELQKNHFSRDSIQHIFTAVDLKAVERIVLEVMRKHEYFLDNYSLLNYCLHLGLTIEIHSKEAIDNRYSKEISDSRYSEEPSMLLKDLGSPDIQEIVHDIYQKLKEIYQSPYTLSDIYQASVLMMTRAVTTQVGTLRYHQLSAILGDEITSLMDNIIVSVDCTYGIQLGQNEDFLIRFAFHLNNLLLRLQMGIRISNLQFSEIKQDYPFMYAIAVHISNIIFEQEHLQLPEDEIAYISLHIGVMMEEQLAIHNRVSCVLVCPDYNLLSTHIFKRISRVCNENLLIVNIYTSIEQDTDLSGIDLVITTVPLNLVDKHQLIINPFMTESDFRSLFFTIDAVRKEKISNRIREKILHFFHEDLFFIDPPLKNQNETIDFICNRMAELGYVEPDFKQRIYDHERLASSSYGRVAITHPLDNRGSTSVIAVSLNHEPIQWGSNRVRLTFIFTLQEKDRDLFSDIFEFITRNVSDDDSFERLMDCKTFDEFTDVLIEFSPENDL